MRIFSNYIVSSNEKNGNNDLQIIIQVFRMTDSKCMAFSALEEFYYDRPAENE